MNESNFNLINTEYLEVPISLIGKELDESNLYYFNQRYYDPSIGRFINVDPIQDGTNWYIYCNNNPMNMVDPTGLKTGIVRSHVREEYYKMTAQQGIDLLSDSYTSNSNSYGKSLSKATKDIAGRILSRTLGGELKDMYNTYKDFKALYSVAKIYLSSDDTNHKSNAGGGNTVASMLKGGNYKPEDTLAVFTKTTMTMEKEFLGIPYTSSKTFYTADFYNKDGESMGTMHFNNDNGIKEILNNYSSYNSKNEYTEKPFEINQDNIKDSGARLEQVNENS